MNLEINDEYGLADLDKFNDIYLDLFKKTLEIIKFNDNVQMSVTFVNKEFIHQLNKNYRNIDRPTDVISFAYLDDKNEHNIKSPYPIDLGEIYICIDVAKENALQYKNSLNRELSFLFVHGLLHLLGYDHMKQEDEEVMFHLQDIILGDKNE